MNNEEFLKGREKYNNLVEQKKKIEEANSKRLLEIDAMMNVLLKDEKVKAYLDLLSEKKDLESTFEKKVIDAIFNGKKEKSFAHQAFADICSSTVESNNIYVDMGVNSCGCHVYKNLETLETRTIDESIIFWFQNNNKVIIPKSKDRESVFNILREMFFHYLSRYTQEESVEYILKNRM